MASKNESSDLSVSTPAKADEQKKKVNKRKMPMVRRVIPLQHICNLVYNSGLPAHIKKEYYVNALNQEFFECSIFESIGWTTRLIGVEYIISDRIYNVLPREEQNLWHPHSSVLVREDLATNKEVRSVLHKTKIDNLARTYGKFWNTWLVDTGAVIPLGVPSPMVSSQALSMIPEKPKRRKPAPKKSEKPMNMIPEKTKQLPKKEEKPMTPEKSKQRKRCSKKKEKSCKSSDVAEPKEETGKSSDDVAESEETDDLISTWIQTIKEKLKKASADKRKEKLCAVGTSQ